MEKDPFVIKQEAADIHDPDLSTLNLEIDGDIVIEDSYRKQPVADWRDKKSLRLLALIVFIIFGALFTKLYYLQVVLGAQYYGAAEGNRIKSIPIIPPRGVIVDYKGKRLAYNIPDFALLVSPSDLPSDQESEDDIFLSIYKGLF